MERMSMRTQMADFEIEKSVQVRFLSLYGFLYGVSFFMFCGSEKLLFILRSDGYSRTSKFC